MSRKPTEISLLRTRRDTVRWYTTSPLLRAITAALLIAALTGTTAVEWSPLTSWAGQVTGYTARHDAEVTLAKKVAAARETLSTDVATLQSTIETADLLPATQLAEPKRLVSICRADSVDQSASLATLNGCIHKVTTSTANVTEQSVSAVTTKKKADAAKAKAAAVETAKQAATARAAVAAEAAAAKANSTGSTSSGSGSKSSAPTSPSVTPVAPASPAAPSGGGSSAATATGSVSATCTTSATVTFTVSGTGTLHLSIAGGGSTSGSGSISLSKSGGPGTYSASYSATGGSVHSTWGSTGSCS